MMARPLLALSWMARPLVWFLTASSNVCSSRSRDRTTFPEARISKEEMQQMVEEAAETGALHEHASEIASRALQFDQAVLRDVMVPAHRMDALPLHAKPDQLRRFLLEERRSRIPVYEGASTTSSATSAPRTSWPLAWEGGPIVLPTCCGREAVPRDRAGHRGAAVHAPRAPAPGHRHRRARRAWSGMVTFEDLVEELVGDIFSEHEVDIPMITREPDGSAHRPRRHAHSRRQPRAGGRARQSREGATTIARAVRTCWRGHAQPPRAAGGRRRIGAGRAGGVGAPSSGCA